ncbi:HEPN domain-containing protein [Dyella mobilis]|uniref:Apea-like HEPN domain-containing protein n=1 Tax=Dyella mobilis TaxID=1849582 RepID=A0ABS2KIJ5_9GAMM|nr:HEPN domain-containing protein [Dyella mobilis]MBM7130987.1 hypothetical protein [Dyella mobilis]GLQ97616.1 hypothetical protein GCM10007863_20360 [Dyella mobilis]
MTDLGLSSLRTIVTILSDVDLFEGCAGYSDVHSGCLNVLNRCLAERVQPENAEELVSLVKAEVEESIDDRTFVVPMYGIELVDVDALQLGTLRIVDASIDLFDKDILESNHDMVDFSMKKTKVRYWLIGSVHGTSRVAEEKFLQKSEFVVGLLALYAASMYERGDSGFRISAAMAPKDAFGYSEWFSWRSKQRVLSVHSSYFAKQPFMVDRELMTQFAEEGVLDVACRIFESKERNQLEEAIAKAVYWYADAHREVVPVMKLIKYWSAVEVFFSGSRVDITESSSIGVATVLVFGGCGFVSDEQYDETRKRVKDLYASRSKALHSAFHDHVSGKDVAEMSQLVAWMLINMIVLQMRGYTTLDEVKKQAERLDWVMKSAKDRPELG